MKKKMVTVLLALVVAASSILGGCGEAQETGGRAEDTSKPVGIHIDGPKYQYSKILTDDIVVEYNGAKSDCSLTNYNGVVVLDSASYISDTVGLYLGDEHFSCPVDLIYNKGIEWNWELSDTDIMNYVSPPDAYDEDGTVCEDALKYQDGLQPEFFTGTITYTDGEVGKVQPDSVICREDSQGVNLYFIFYGKEYSKPIKFDRTGYSGLTLQENIERGNITVSEETKDLLESPYFAYFPTLKEGGFDSNIDFQLSTLPYIKADDPNLDYSNLKEGKEGYLKARGADLVEYLNNIDESWWTNMSVKDGFFVLAGSKDFGEDFFKLCYSNLTYIDAASYSDSMWENHWDLADIVQLAPDLDLCTVLYIWGLPEDLIKDGVDVSINRLNEDYSTREDLMGINMYILLNGRQMPTIDVPASDIIKMGSIDNSEDVGSDTGINEPEAEPEPEPEMPAYVIIGNPDVDEYWGYDTDLDGYIDVWANPMPADIDADGDIDGYCDSDGYIYRTLVSVDIDGDGVVDGFRLTDRY